MADDATAASAFASFASVASIPLTGNGAGFYADVDLGVGSDVVRYIWDVTDSQWTQQSGAVTAETPSTIKTKYEANADTNVFSDTHKAKLENISDASDISAFTAALDAALA